MSAPESEPGTGAGAAPETVVSPAVAASFRFGQRRGEDPRNAVTAGPTRTTLDSEWWDQVCAHCGHTFREDDEVVVELAADATIASVRHASALLPCAAPASGQPGSDQPAVDISVAERFFRGMTRADREGSSEGPPVWRLPEDHPLVERRQGCSYCVTTLRPYEAVVICPCSPARPGCQDAIHHDPGRGLGCYDSQYPDGRVTRCASWFAKVAPAGTTSGPPSRDPAIEEAAAAAAAALFSGGSVRAVIIPREGGTRS